MDQNYNVFISYRGAGSGGFLGKEIYADLLLAMSKAEQPDVVPFFAPACIKKGENFKQVIHDVIQKISCVILVLSPGFFEHCTDDDDMVRYELEQSLANPGITFIPVVMEGFSFDKELSAVESLFSREELNRFKHVNAINHHGVYDFNTEAEVLPVIRRALEKSADGDNDGAKYVRFDLSDFNAAGQRTVRFGRYPQKLLKNEDLVHRIYEGLATGDTKKDGNRYEFKGLLYYSVQDNKFNKRVFETEKADGSHNFYCVEPLRWLEIYSGEKYSVLITEEIIDAKMFNPHRGPHRNPRDSVTTPANDWERSYIRQWLNEEFYFDAFSDSERKYIRLSLLNNSGDSDYPDFARDKPDTEDWVFLISHKEIYTVKTGVARVSDYARANGAYSSTSATCDGFGDWWTRSPGNIESSVENVDRRGCLDAVPFCNYVNDTAAGVRPCIIVDKGVFANDNQEAYS